MHSVKGDYWCIKIGIIRGMCPKRKVYWGSDVFDHFPSVYKIEMNDWNET